jgi:hypothetical protein
MDYLIVLQIYGVVSAALAGTSYITLYKPAIQLLEEIVESDTPYGGWLGFIIWNLAAIIAAPWTAYVLLQNNNEEFIERFAVVLAERIIAEEEEGDE